MIVVDSGPLVAAANTADVNHHRCVELFASLRLNGERMVVPAFVITEVCFLLARRGGSKAESDFVRSLAGGDFRVVQPDTDAFQRIADLIDQYADFPLGLVDASVVALAEELNVTEVATLDRRHFSVVRPLHADVFTLLP